MSITLPMGAGVGGPRPGVVVGALTGPLTVRAMVHAAKAFIEPLAFVKERLNTWKNRSKAIWPGRSLIQGKFLS